MKKVDFNKLQAGDLVEVPRTQFAPMRRGWNGWLFSEAVVIRKGVGRKSKKNVVVVEMRTPAGKNSYGTIEATFYAENVFTTPAAKNARNILKKYGIEDAESFYKFIERDDVTGCDWIRFLIENTYNNKLGKTDAEYTAAVDNGSYGNFVKDSAGYGLAQWTYWSRKQALLNHAKQAGVSIADLNMQLGFLWEELQGYTAVMDALKKAGSVRAASDAVLTGYEKPADQSETVKKKRAEYGEGYYKKYAAGNGTKYYRVRKSWTDAASQLGAFTSLENAKSACKAGYTVYDDNGKAVYTAAGQQTSAGVPFSVQVDILDLNIRTGAGTNYAKTGETTGKGVFTIVEVKAGQGASAGWGRLKSGAGWISLDYATRLA